MYLLIINLKIDSCKKKKIRLLKHAHSFDTTHTGIHFISQYCLTNLHVHNNFDNSGAQSSMTAKLSMEGKIHLKVTEDATLCNIIEHTFHMQYTVKKKISLHLMSQVPQFELHYTLELQNELHTNNLIACP